MTEVRGEAGSTLFELLITTALIGAVSAMAAPMFANAMASAGHGGDRRNLSIALANTGPASPVLGVPPERSPNAKGSQTEINDPETLNNLGQVLARDGHPDEALPRLERAVVLAPENWAYRFNLAHAVGQLGQWDRAVSEYREAVRLFPTDYATQFNLAMALHKTGEEQAAISEFEKAIELAPGEASFHVSLGVSLEAAGRINDAVAEFKRYLDMAPSAPDAQQLKAHVDALVAGHAQLPSPS